MKIPGYDEVRAFEAAHFTAAEQARLAPLVRALPKARGLSLDDSTLVTRDYGLPS